MCIPLHTSTPLIATDTHTTHTYCTQHIHTTHIHIATICTYSTTLHRTLLHYSTHHNTTHTPGTSHRNHYTLHSLSLRHCYKKIYLAAHRNSLTCWYQGYLLKASLMRCSMDNFHSVPELNKRISCRTRLTPEAKF